MTLLSDTAIAELVRRHAAEGKFARMKHNVPAGFGHVYIGPDDSTEVVSRSGSPVPLQNTESGREVLALSRRDRARFILEAFDLILVEMRTADSPRDQKYDSFVLKKTIQRLLLARVEWRQKELADLVDVTVINYSGFMTDLALWLFRHVRRFDLLDGVTGSAIRAAARTLRPNVQFEPYRSKESIEKLRAVLGEIIGGAEIVDFGKKLGA